MPKTPIQVIAVRDPNDHHTDLYVDVLRLAFEGALANKGSPSTYLADSLDLGIHVLDPQGMAEADFDPSPILAAAKQSVVVDIRNPLSGRPQRLEDNAAALRDEVGEKAVLEVMLPGPIASGDTQLTQGTEKDVEPAMLPAVTAIRAIVRARKLLDRELGRDPERATLKLFISHAKLDGVPMALSLLSLMNRIQEIESFYDVIDIPKGSDWRQVLKDNAQTSVLVALRTEQYEKRYWCRTEYLWAERRRVPLLVVDLRNEQYHAAARLPFENAPSVRVHDGNLMRVIFHALACHLRVLRMQSLLKDRGASGVGPSIVLPRHPSPLALAGAVDALRSHDDQPPGGKTTGELIYPGPRIPKPALDALAPALDNDSTEVSLLTPDEL